MFLGIAWEKPESVQISPKFQSFPFLAFNGINSLWGHFLPLMAPDYWSFHHIWLQAISKNDHLGTPLASRDWEGFEGGVSGKEPPANAGDVGDMGSIPGMGRFPGGGHGNPLSRQVFLLGESHGQRSLASYSRETKILNTVWYSHTHTKKKIITKQYCFLSALDK